MKAATGAVARVDDRVPVARAGFPRRTPAALLDAAWQGILEAESAAMPAERYALAHLSALRCAAAVLAARARPGSARRGPTSAWALLAAVAPEMGEWATFFAAGATKRAAAVAGLPHAVSEREADDLMRDAQRFFSLVESGLGASRSLSAAAHG